jgi:Protein of unknown function (DUF1573)
MKIQIILFLAVFALSTEGVSQQYPTPRPKATTKSARTTNKSSNAKSVAHIKFTEDKLDFGTIKEDAVVEKCFEFTNTGNTDLLILDAEASCGCTVPSYPKHPIPPGGKGILSVKYTAKNKVGPQKPVVTVVTNGSPSVNKLYLEGWVDQIPSAGN